MVSRAVPPGSDVIGGEVPINPDLSICIPTFNRARLLDGTLAELIPVAAAHRVPICISDNASVDGTKEVVERHARSYPHLRYGRNPENVGFDRNVRLALRMAPTRFAWLHADDDRLALGGVERVLSFIGSGAYEMIVVNGGGWDGAGGGPKGRVGGIGSREYLDGNDLLADLGWHMTWVTCLIFGRGMRDRGDFEKYFDTGFVHLGAIFDYLRGTDASVYWASDPLVAGSREAKGVAVWYPKTVELWARMWPDFIRSLPGYSEEAKSRCIKAHGVMTGIFDVGNLLALRAAGHYDLSVFRKYRERLPQVADTPELGFLAAAAIPERLAKVKIARSLVKRLSEAASLLGLTGFRAAPTPHPNAAPRKE